MAGEENKELSEEIRSQEDGPDDWADRAEAMEEELKAINDAIPYNFVKGSFAVEGVQGMVKEIDRRGSEIIKATNALITRGNELESAKTLIGTIDGANTRLRNSIEYFEGAVCTDDLLRAVHQGNDVKEISTEKVMDVLHERNVLKERIVEIENERTWVRRKLGVPLANKVGSVQGELHVLVSAAEGYENYIAAYKCDDKQGEIARQSVAIKKLEGQLKEAEEALRCTSCNKRVGAYREGEGYVIRAFIECPECTTESAPGPKIPAHSPLMAHTDAYEANMALIADVTPLPCPHNYMTSPCEHSDGHHCKIPNPDECPAEASVSSEPPAPGYHPTEDDVAEDKGPPDDDKVGDYFRRRHRDLVTEVVSRYDSVERVLPPIEDDPDRGEEALYPEDKDPDLDIPNDEPIPEDDPNPPDHRDEEAAGLPGCSCRNPDGTPFVHAGSCAGDEGQEGG